MRLVVHAPSSEVFMEKIWLKNYPANMPQEIDASQYGSLVALLDEAMRKYKDRVAFRCMGASLTYAELDQLSARVASWLQAQGLKKERPHRHGHGLRGGLVGRVVGLTGHNP